MRRVIGCLVVALVAAGCRDATAASTPPFTGSTLEIRESPSPFTEVTAGPVTALVPDDWHPRLLATDARQGLIATPRLADWARAQRPIEGMAAMWIDGTRLGVPSDYYYLAATGPALDSLTRSPECSATRRLVVVNHRPAFADGPPDSPGDYIAVGRGVCRVRDTSTRWAYFVAAPGYGPARALGIPSSGLYLVVAVMRDSPRAPELLDKLLRRIEFGGASVSDFISAAKAA